MQFIKNFQKSRSTKIGASEISACIPHPDRPGQSVAGYGLTALTIWQYKTGQAERPPAGFEAEMGNVLEPVIIRQWLREHAKDSATADAFYRGYMLCELDRKADGYPDAASFQNTPYLHHTTAETDYAISHADMISPDNALIVEAKSAQFWASRRRHDNPYDGYDPELKGSQGVPLKHFFQVQFQAAIYQAVYGIQLDRLFVALLFNTSNFHSWEIRPDKRVQGRLLEIASYMKKCIDKNTAPRDLAMNQGDIKIMYPRIEDDYRIISGDELTHAVGLARTARQAAEQIKTWKARKEEAEDSLSVILKDTKTVKGIIDGQITDIATWQERAGAERLTPLSEIKQDDRLYKYMVKNGLIRQGEPSRSVKVKLKGK